jgi:hypothetical protein
VRARSLLQRCVAPFVIAAAIFSVPSVAVANSAMGAAAAAQIFAFLIAPFALLAAAVLGLLAVKTALRPPSAVGLIFARGFLGVSSVAAFAIGIMLLAIAFGDTLKGASGLVFGSLFAVALGVLAAEFAVAGKLYGRVYADRKSKLALVFGVVSFFIAGIFALLLLLLLIVTIGMHFFP